MGEEKQKNELTLPYSPEQAAIVENLKPSLERFAEQLRQGVKLLGEVLRKAATVATRRMTKLLEAELFYANEHPKWWHYYKHAKKARVRKKYRRMLMKQLLNKLEVKA